MGKRRRSGPGEKRPTGPAPAPADAVRALDDLEQIKVLADPLRIGILQALCRERTTKQVAEVLGEKPTKLYHHVEALERVGLIRLARTRRNRGTLEKYYIAVARKFRVDPTVFSAEAAEEPAGHPLETMISTLLDTTGRELRALVSGRSGASVLEDEGVVSFVEVHASAREIAELRDRFLGLLEELGDTGAADEDDEPERRYRLTLAFYPLDAGS